MIPLNAGPTERWADLNELSGSGAIPVRRALALLATGYDYLIPYVDPALFDWRQGRPDLFANIAHRTLDGLYVLGFVEFADAAYQRFDEMAQVVVMDAHAHRTGEHLDEMRRLRREAHPDLAGGHHYVDSARHAGYVDSPTYQRYLADLRDRFGFADPDDDFYGPPTLDLTAQPDSAPAGTVHS